MITCLKSFQTKIWTYQLTLFEKHPFSDDDKREHQIARIKLFRKTYIPVGNGLVAAHPKLAWTHDAPRQVLEQYKKVRDDAKLLMGGNLPVGHLLVIDRHKIAAAFIIATLDVLPLRLIGNQDAELEIETLANECLAFESAIRVLRIFANHDAASMAGSPEAKAPGLIFPPTEDGINYEHQAYRALRHARIQGGKNLDLPLLAHWMFYIEKYWRLASQQ